jgi:restriction system protein
VKLEMHKNSLFAILLRSPFWISFGVAAGLFLVARLFLPVEYAAIVPLPFVVVGCMAAWKQLRAPSAGKVARTLERVREMAWTDFAAALEAAWQRDGYAVNRLQGGAADFELVRAGRATLVAAKRWKAARTGLEPLRDLHELRRKREAYDCAYVCAGELTEQARKYAADHNVRLVEGAELAQRLRELAAAR